APALGAGRARPCRLRRALRAALAAPAARSDELPLAGRRRLGALGRGVPAPRPQPAARARSRAHLRPPPRHPRALPRQAGRRLRPRPSSRLVSERETAPLGYRPALDGLRAVSVLGVVGFHALALPGGGFLGVDVFFVLSGFLITNLLLQEHAVTGRLDLLRFYARRARRLLPALVAAVAGFLAIEAFADPNSLGTD